MIDYSWVPWLGELVRKIAAAGRDGLPVKAGRVDWVTKESSRRVSKYGDDPFSFICSLCADAGSENLTKRLKTAAAAFSIDQGLPDPRAMPTMNPRSTLFDGKGVGKPVPDVLWELFRTAAAHPAALDERLFNQVLRIHDVGMNKLTQALFIINPSAFLPRQHRKSILDDQFNRKVDEWNEYKAWMESAHRIFPGCAPYEINEFVYDYSKPNGGLLRRDTNYFCVNSESIESTVDHWPDFDKLNAVWTDFRGPAGRPDPLTAVKKGDVILVASSKSGRAIGVVQDNGYKNGWQKDARISVYWINKSNARFAREPAQVAFDFADKKSETYQAFSNTIEFADTLALVTKLTDKAAAPASELRTAPLSRRDAGPLNRILYGPPGTGKTYEAVREAVKIVDEGKLAEEPSAVKSRFNELRGRDGQVGQVEFVTFHQNYAYEDFIEGIRPRVKEKELAYELHEGIFKKLAKAAKAEDGKRFVLIIDEINRGNIAKIFGELITLIEDSKRLGRKDEMQATLPYSGDPFGVPENLYLIGTMNTADRGIALLDMALRRRFEFHEQMPDATHVSVSKNIGGVDCQKLLTTMNERIVEHLDRDHQIGHTYLMKTKVETLNDLGRVFRTEIVPLLQEYFYDNWEKMRLVLNENCFITKKPGSDPPVFDVLQNDDPGWHTPDSYTAIYKGKSGKAAGA